MQSWILRSWSNPNYPVKSVIKMLYWNNTSEQIHAQICLLQGAFKNVSVEKQFCLRSDRWSWHREWWDNRLPIPLFPPPHNPIAYDTASFRDIRKAGGLSVCRKKVLVMICRPKGTRTALFLLIWQPQDNSNRAAGFRSVSFICFKLGSAIWGFFSETFLLQSLESWAWTNTNPRYFSKWVWWTFSVSNC